MAIQAGLSRGLTVVREVCVDVPCCGGGEEFLLLTLGRDFGGRGGEGVRREDGFFLERPRRADRSLGRSSAKTLV